MSHVLLLGENLARGVLSPTGVRFREKGTEKETSHLKKNDPRNGLEKDLSNSLLDGR